MYFLGLDLKLRSYKFIVKTTSRGNMIHLIQALFD